VKRTTRRRLSLGAQYAVFAAVVVVLVLIADWEAIRSNFFDLAVLENLWPEIVTIAAKNTLIYTSIAFGGGLVLAVFLALMRLSSVPPYRWAARGYIEFFRGLPALLVIIAFGFAIPIAFQWRPPGGTTGAGVMALTVVASAYMAETLRAGIQAVPKGQVEAARSLGMSSTRTMFSIVLPQAFRIVIPPLTNEFVLLLKDTSLLYVIGMTLDQRELTTFARAAQSTYADSSPLVAAAVLYLIITLPLTQLVTRLEQRQARAR
jgi:polar amino acid transport system permease protein